MGQVKKLLLAATTDDMGSVPPNIKVPVQEGTDGI